MKIKLILASLLLLAASAFGQGQFGGGGSSGGVTNGSSPNFGTVTASGNFNTTGGCYQVAGTCLASANLTDHANIPLYNTAGAFSATQTFNSGVGITINGTSGGTTITGCNGGAACGTFNLSLPLITGNDSIPALNVANIWTANQQFPNGAVGTPAIFGTASATTGFFFSGTTIGVATNGANSSTFGTTGFKSLAYASNTNCNAIGTAAQPSVASCGSSPTGLFSCSTSATSTCQVNTTATSNSSTIIVQQRTDATAGTRIGVTCNTNLSTTLPVVTASTGGTSFTITISQPATNPDCFDYWVVN